MEVSFTWTIFPLWHSKFSFEYLLPLPRSAPKDSSSGLAPRVLQRPSRPPTHWGLVLALMVGYRSRSLAPSIFGASWFGRWVVTDCLADSNFHDHCPAILVDQHTLWVPCQNKQWRWFLLYHTFLIKRSYH